MVDMDETLDYEDEEDEYDRVAAGTIMGTNDGLFMNRVGSCSAGWQQSNPLSTSFADWRQPYLRYCSTNDEAILARLQDDREATIRATNKVLELGELGPGGGF